MKKGMIVCEDYKALRIVNDLPLPPHDIELIEVPSRLTFTEFEDILDDFNGRYTERYICSSTPPYAAMVLGYVAFNSENNELLKKYGDQSTLIYLHYDAKEGWIEVEL